MACSNNNQQLCRMEATSISSPRQSDEDPVSQSSAVSMSSGGIFFGPPVEWASDPYRISDTADEQSCRIRFIAMAMMLQHKAQTNDAPKNRLAVRRTDITFNEDDNVSHIRIIQPSGTSETRLFGGKNSQFIPPETVEPGIYHPSLADVWTLGICLYRMLTGKYPFAAENDRTMFAKMVRLDLSIPQNTSEDAKDLLLKMLAPHHSRASLDAILFHPWLNPHRHGFASAQPRVSPARLLMRALKTFVYGPYPPPKRPYQELFLGHWAPASA
ncbi:kinase-like domain-containing protein [Dichotomocladium elegans]|nr:kinase-like domain-containing protein [Dichotomocladium elegans]